MSKRKKVGLSPGSLVYTGKQTSNHSSVRSILFNKEKLEESTSFSNKSIDLSMNQWVEVYGVHEAELIQQIGNEFKIHTLVLEDIMDIANRVKLEIYDNGVFCILQYLKLNMEDKSIRNEQISIFFSNKFLISFQEDPDDSFSPIRKRMLVENSRLRNRNCDYLFYALVDYIVDCYFIISDSIDLEISAIEESVHRGLEEELVVDVYSIRTKLMKFRNFVYPLREEVSKIKKQECDIIQSETLIYFRDLEDHLIQLIEISDHQRELLNGIKDLIFSQSSIKLNRDIKWLTVLSTISIPIVLLTGIYGMNFKYMPELEWRYGYLLWWILTISIICSLFLFFKRKKLF
ncbi:MAG: magnesium/cobalt transporter CorA [Saprospiraceae bacterium]